MRATGADEDDAPRLVAFFLPIILVTPLLPQVVHADGSQLSAAISHFV